MKAMAEDRSEERAADNIVSQLEAMIVSGELADGAPLPAERDLMNRFDASRTVVREAVTILSIRGLVENRPRFRPTVRRPDFQIAVNAVGGIARFLLAERSGVRNLFETRVFIERGLVRDAAQYARKNDIECLREALRANRAAIGSPDEFYTTDSDFHGVLYGISGNPIMPAVHHAFKSWLASHWRRMPGSRERDEINYRSHETILQAIVDRDPDAAEQALTTHLQLAWEYVRVTFDPDQL